MSELTGRSPLDDGNPNRGDDGWPKKPYYVIFNTKTGPRFLRNIFGKKDIHLCDDPRKALWHAYLEVARKHRRNAELCSLDYHIAVMDPGGDIIDLDNGEAVSYYPGYHPGVGRIGGALRKAQGAPYAE